MLKLKLVKQTIAKTERLEKKALAVFVKAGQEPKRRQRRKKTEGEEDEPDAEPAWTKEEEEELKHRRRETRERRNDAIGKARFSHNILTRLGGVDVFDPCLFRMSDEKAKPVSDSKPGHPVACLLAPCYIPEAKLAHSWNPSHSAFLAVVASRVSIDTELSPLDANLLLTGRLSASKTAPVYASVRRHLEPTFGLCLSFSLFFVSFFTVTVSFFVGNTPI